MELLVCRRVLFRLVGPRSGFCGRLGIRFSVEASDFFSVVANPPVGDRLQPRSPRVNYYAIFRVLKWKMFFFFFFSVFRWLQRKPERDVSVLCISIKERCTAFVPCHYTAVTADRFNMVYIAFAASRHRQLTTAFPELLTVCKRARWKKNKCRDRRGRM